MLGIIRCNYKNTSEFDPYGKLIWTILGSNKKLVQTRTDSEQWIDPTGALLR